MGQDEDVDARGSIEVLDPSGHIDIRWGKAKSDVDYAEAQFKDLLSKGYLAFKKRWLGRKGEEVKTFDPSLGALIFDKPAPNPVPLPVAKTDPEAEKVAAEKAAEEAALKERVETTKKLHDEAADKSIAAKREHEAVTRKRREAREAKTKAELESASLKSSYEAATRHREEVTAKLAVHGEGLAPLQKELEDAVAAEAEAKKAYDAAVEKARVAAATLDEADEAEKAAYAKRREADKLATSTERDYEDAMTALHGPPTSEQTREFEKKGKTTMTPPMQGG